MKISLSILFVFFVGFAIAQKSGREVLPFNEGWQFTKKDSAAGGKDWQNIRLPHTWNVDDVLDDTPGYYRGVCWYKKGFHPDAGWKGKQISVYFEGANQEADVYINGKKAGHHVGGYSGFSIDVTPYLNWNGRNELLVKLDNSYNESIAPLSADFTFYGGIYRDVYLVATNKIHFATTDHGSNGIYISTPSVSKESASAIVKALISNSGKNSSKVVVTTTITDQDGKRISESKTLRQLKPGLTDTVLQKFSSIKNPMLWSPENPYRYTVETRISDVNGTILDIEKNQLGFRWFSFDASKGFFLNGSSYKLIGASRHQDYKGLGNAVPDSLAINDVVLLKRMGANFLRVAHYPQDPCVLKACDSLGLLASVEIPIVNEITETENFYRNCEEMQTEMVRQNFNHPSVILWCYMNEVLLRSHFSNDKDRQKIYLNNVASLARRLEKLTRKEDPYRYTMMADHGNLAQYEKAGLLEIPMIIGWNLYSGWYGGSMEEFPQFLDEFHSNYPNKAFIVTEYGADADPRIRSVQPVRFDKSIEYTTRFHQYYLTEMMKRPYVAGAVVWNLADFNSETRTETMPHMNNKGLLQWDRTPKDPYYFYEAMLSKTPFIKILGSCQKNFGIADSTQPFCYVPIQIASNLDSVRVVLNGIDQTTLPITDGLCEWKLPFRDGANVLIAEGKRGGEIFNDTIHSEIHLQPRCLTDTRYAFRQMNILLGSSRYFIDEDGQWWQPDQAYAKGSWGFIGGKKFKLANNGRLPYGTDKNILNTDDDPIYQTQQTGIQQYRLDVPPGKYEITLHFAELLGGIVRVPPYNLSDDERDEKIRRRIFNVVVNGKLLLDHFNIAEEYGLSNAVSKSSTVIVAGNEGISIQFEPIEGEPVLNALQLKKLAGEVEK